MEITDKHLEYFEFICKAIESGQALRNAVKGLMSTASFYEIVDSNEENKKRYVRACEARSEAIFEDILDIADEKESDKYIDENGLERVNNEVVQRSRLKIDARKWMLAKMNPTKYGDKIEADLKHSGEIKVNLSKEEAKDIANSLNDEF